MAATDWMDMDSDSDSEPEANGCTTLCKMLLGSDDGSDDDEVSRGKCDATLALRTIRQSLTIALRTHKDGDYLGGIPVGQEGAVVDTLIGITYHNAPGGMCFKASTSMVIPDLTANDIYASTGSDHEAYDRYSKWHRAFQGKNTKRFAALVDPKRGLAQIISNGPAVTSMGFGLVGVRGQGGVAEGGGDTSATVLRAMVAAPTAEENQAIRDGKMLNEQVISTALDQLNLLALVRDKLTEFTTKHAEGHPVPHLVQLEELMGLASTTGDKVSFQPICRVIMLQPVRAHERMAPGIMRKLFAFIDASNDEIKQIVKTLMRDAPAARATTVAQNMITMVRSASNVTAWPGPNVFLALSSSGELLGVKKDTLNSKEVAWPKLNDGRSLKLSLILYASAMRQRDIAVWHDTELAMAIEAIDAIEQDEANTYIHSMCPKPVRQLIAYTHFAFKWFFMVMDQMETLKSRNQFKNAATISRTIETWSDSLIGPKLGAGGTAKKARATTASEAEKALGLGIRTSGFTAAAGSVLIDESGWRPLLSSAVTDRVDVERPNTWVRSSNEDKRLLKAFIDQTDVNSMVKCIPAVPIGVAFKVSHNNYIIDIQAGDRIEAFANKDGTPFVGSESTKVICDTDTHTWVIRKGTGKNGNKRPAENQPAATGTATETQAQKKKKLAAEKKAKEALAAANKAAANAALVTPNKNQVQVAIPTLNSKPTGQQAAGGAQGLELKSAENLKPYERLTKGEMRAIDEILLTGIATGGAGKCTLFGAKDGSPHACIIDILAITLDQNVGHFGCNCYMCDDKVRWCTSGVHIYAKTKFVLRKQINGGPFKNTVSDTISDALVDQATKLDPAKIHALQKILGGTIAPFNHARHFLKRNKDKQDTAGIKFQPDPPDGPTVLANQERYCAKFRNKSSTE